MDAKYIKEEENEYIKEPKDGLIRFEPRILAQLRKKYNLAKRVDRDNIYATITEWIKQQNHFMKKDFSQGYIERCIANSKGSIERTKIQLDRMCTLRTLMPEYFQITDLKNSELIRAVDIANIALLPKLTDDLLRIVVLKVKPNVVIKSMYFKVFYKFIAFLAEYLMSNDCCEGYILIGDIFDASMTEIISKINLVELQQFLPILTEGYSTSIKGIYFVTDSKIVETLLNMFKQVLPAKIAGRIVAARERAAVKNLIKGDVLPNDYGGSEETIEILHENLIRSFSEEPVKSLLTEMNKAGTDESKRRIYDFNDKCMGMPGTFRTLSLD